VVKAGRFLSAAALIGAAWVGVGAHFYGAVLDPRRDKRGALRGLRDGNDRTARHAADAWLADAPARSRVTIDARDGLRLSAIFLPAAEPSHRWAVCVHGYMSRAERMGVYARWYHERGYQVLLPDLRGHGESEGRYIAMGWHDRMDLFGWLFWILLRDREAEIVLHGVSMGASAVLMAAGETLPENVRAAVSDCAFTSAWDELRDQAAHRYPHVPPRLMMRPLDAVTRARAGYGLREADALAQVKKARIPILFVHGDADRYIPPEMMERLYAAKPGARARLLVEGAGHMGAVDRAPEAYWDAVGRLLGPLGL